MMFGAITKKITQLTVLACTLTIGLTLSEEVQAIPFDQISQVYFFGDSLTDSGFNNNITAANGFPNKAPTFTTFGGYTWAQYVARDIKGFALPTGPFPDNNDKITNNTTPLFAPVPVVTPDLTGIDYACGGSKTGSNPGVTITWAPSLEQQIQHFLNTSPAVLDPHAVYFIWSGANDILDLLGQTPLPNQQEFIRIADIATTNIANQVAALGQRGAKRIVVLALPNLGSTPLVQQLARVYPGLSVRMKNLSFFFDSMMNRKLGAVISLQQINVLYFNAYVKLDNILAVAQSGLPYVINGQSFYFANTTTPACGTISALFCPNTSNHYFFADSVHPTDEAHRVLSLEMENSLLAWST